MWYSIWTVSVRNYTVMYHKYTHTCTHTHTIHIIRKLPVSKCTVYCIPPSVVEVESAKNCWYSTPLWTCRKVPCCFCCILQVWERSNHSVKTCMGCGQLVPVNPGWPPRLEALQLECHLSTQEFCNALEWKLHSIGRANVSVFTNMLVITA